MSTFTRESPPLKPGKTEWVAMNVKVRREDIPILNQRLKLLGFETLGQLTRAHQWNLSTRYRRQTNC